MHDAQADVELSARVAEYGARITQAMHEASGVDPMTDMNAEVRALQAMAESSERAGNAHLWETYQREINRISARIRDSQVQLAAPQLRVPAESLRWLDQQLQSQQGQLMAQRPGYYHVIGGGGGGGSGNDSADALQYSAQSFERRRRQDIGAEMLGQRPSFVYQGTRIQADPDVTDGVAYLMRTDMSERLALPPPGGANPDLRDSIQAALDSAYVNTGRPPDTVIMSYRRYAELLTHVEGMQMYGSRSGRLSARQFQQQVVRPPAPELVKFEADLETSLGELAQELSA